MHTLEVICVGLMLLAVCALFGHSLAGKSGAAAGVLTFFPLWLIGAAANLMMGVKRAGYTVSQEVPIFLLVFAVPAAGAFILWWRLK